MKSQQTESQVLFDNAEKKKQETELQAQCSESQISLDNEEKKKWVLIPLVQSPGSIPAGPKSSSVLVPRTHQQLPVTTYKCQHHSYNSASSMQVQPSHIVASPKHRSGEATNIHNHKLVARVCHLFWHLHSKFINEKQNKKQSNECKTFRITSHTIVKAKDAQWRAEH